MKRQRNTIQIKKQTKNTWVQINDEEIGTLSGKKNKKNDSKDIRNLENTMDNMQGTITKNQ